MIGKVGAWWICASAACVAVPPGLWVAYRRAHPIECAAPCHATIPPAEWLPGGEAWKWLRGIPMGGAPVPSPVIGIPAGGGPGSFWVPGGGGLYDQSAGSVPGFIVLDRIPPDTGRPPPGDTAPPPVEAVEPSAWWLLMGGLVALYVFRRRG